MSEEIYLEPCPFCGGPAHLRDDSCHSKAFYIGCSKLGCFGSDQWEETQAEAIAAWNARADTAAAQVAAAIEKAFLNGPILKNCTAEEPSLAELLTGYYNQHGFSRKDAEELTAAYLAALATDTQTDALEQVRKEAALKALADMGQEFDADTAAAEVAAAYERGVREAARHAASATGDVGLMNSILALIDYPTPDPDEQTKAQDLAFRKAVSS